MAVSALGAAPWTGAAAAVASPAGGKPLDDERLAGLLSEAADVEGRAAVLQLLRSAAVACPALTRFSARSDPAIREQAVRSMDQAGCGAIEYYRPYMNDPNAWVTDALVTAIERHLIGDAVPFLIHHLHDPRRILSSRGVDTIGERAHRALRVVSCQSLHFDPAGPAQERSRAAARWATWYTDHGGETRDQWIESGLVRARAYLDSDDDRVRLEGLELLLLIGQPAAEILQAAFSRDSEDLETSITCTPQEPPRVTEEVPCLFAVSNRSARRIAFIPGALGVALRRQGAGEDEGSSSISVQSSPLSPDPDPGAGMSAWIGRIVDLEPGEQLGWPVRIGPVSSAGRYEVRGTLLDQSARLVKSVKAVKGGGATAIEARTVVQFNQ